MTGKSLHPATLAAQALGWTEASTGGIVLPLHTSTTFLCEVDRASIEGADSPAPPDLLRLSVGIEDPDDLIADLDAALSPTNDGVLAR